MKGKVTFSGPYIVTQAYVSHLGRSLIPLISSDMHMFPTKIDSSFQADSLFSPDDCVLSDVSLSDALDRRDLNLDRSLDRRDLNLDRRDFNDRKEFNLNEKHYTDDKQVLITVVF